MWFADVEATLPSGKFPTPAPTDSEERFGKLKFGADWVGKLKIDELTILERLCPQWGGYVDAWGDRVDPGRTQWRYDGPEELLPVAKKVMERAERGNKQLAYVRRGLALLKRFGPGDAPPPGSPYHYDLDVLDSVAELNPDDRELLIEFRQYRWLLRADPVAPAAPVEPSLPPEIKRRPIPASAPRGRMARAVYYAIKEKWGAVGGPPMTMSRQDIANAIRINCSRETVRRALEQRP